MLPFATAAVVFLALAMPVRGQGMRPTPRAELELEAGPACKSREVAQIPNDGNLDASSKRRRHAATSARTVSPAPARTDSER